MGDMQGGLSFRAVTKISQRNSSPTTVTKVGNKRSSAKPTAAAARPSPAAKAPEAAEAKPPDAKSLAVAKHPATRPPPTKVRGTRLRGKNPNPEASTASSPTPSETPSQPTGAFAWQ